jgi:hypothetical protein
MNSTYNIYRHQGGNTLAWADRVEGLRQAQQRVIRLNEASAGTYIIFDVRERTVVPAENPKTPKQYLAQCKTRWSALAAEIIGVLAQEEVKIWRQELPHKLRQVKQAS